jgi:hypothetical protein
MRVDHATLATDQPEAGNASLIPRPNALILLPPIVRFVMPSDLIDTADLSDPTLVDPDRRVAQQLYHVHGMTHEQQCSALPAQLDHPELRLGSEVGVTCSEDLIDDQNVRRDRV